MFFILYEQIHNCTSIQPVRVEWNFNTTFIFLYIFVLKYYFDFGNKLFFVIEWGCVACEGSAFFCFYMQSMQLPQEYPKHRFLPLYEEELKNIKQ